MIDDKLPVAIAEVERVLDQWLIAQQSGEDKHELTLSALLALSEAGAPPAMVREVARLALIAVADNRNKASRTGRKEPSLVQGCPGKLIAKVPPKEIVPLVECSMTLAWAARNVGKKRRKLSYLATLTTFAAAVTVLRRAEPLMLLLRRLRHRMELAERT